MDLRMPGGGGVDSARTLRSEGARAAVLVLTTYGTDSETVTAIEAGATGYLLEDAPAERLFEAVRATAAGETVLSPAVVGRLAPHLRAPSGGGSLSARERQVLALVARGTSNPRRRRAVVRQRGHGEDAAGPRVREARRERPRRRGPGCTGGGRVAGQDGGMPNTDAAPAVPRHDPAAARPVVVGVDGSEDSVRAAVLAAGEARRRGLPLLVVHVTPWRTGDDALPMASAEALAEFRQSATRLVEAAAATVRTETGLADVTADVVDDHPVDGLLALSAAAALLVVGATGIGRVPGLLLGSTAGAVVQHARCPVIALPGEPVPADDAPVVAGVDGLPGQDEVLAFAVQEAVARGARLDVVHAWRDVVLEAALGRFGGLVDWAAVEAHTRRELAGVVAPWRERATGLEIREVVVRERTVPALREAAGTASLLVLGHRARGPLTRLGSTTHGVLHRVPCPVAVVPLHRAG